MSISPKLGDVWLETIKRGYKALNYNTKQLAEELDNLALALVMADSEQFESLGDALSIYEEIKNISKHLLEHNEITQQLTDHFLKVDQADKQNKYEELKRLTSSAQSIMSTIVIAPTNSATPSEDNLEVATSSADSKVNAMEQMLESFYNSHKSFMNEIFEKFTELQKTSSTIGEMPSSLHQDVESYVLRLNQDATQIGAKPLSDLAQQLFMLLMQYPLVNIEKELKTIGDFILESVRTAKETGDIASITVPEHITEEMNRIEEKLSGRSEATHKIETPLTVVESPIQNTTTNLGTYTIDADSEILSEFIAEATDHLNAVEAVLLERDLDFSPDDIDTLFRGVHSLKGTSSYFNLLEINESSHLLENILDEVRTGKRKLDSELKSLVLRYVDIQNNLLVSARDAVTKGGIVERSATVQTFIKDIENFFNGIHIVSAEANEVEYTRSNGEETMQEPELEINKPNDPILANNSLEAINTASTPESTNKTNNSSKDNSTSKSFVKIDTERLDSLGEMIGEMVIYSSMLIRKCRELLPNDESTMRMSDQVEKFSRELQDIGMSMRLDPIRGLFQKLSRLVWDTSKKLGKDVKFIVKGEDTELDRNVIERLADPLMHMVRNSLDHGIEDPATRAALGKDRTGIIELSSAHEGGSIVIKIRDDGRGLDPKKLFNKAVEIGIISKEANLTEQEIFQLIFAPGFSTAEKVTDISGRGVGMDVVRTNIESMRGRINIESKLGEGSTFSIELPLTLAIIEGIEAGVGREKYIFPMLSVVELVRPSLTMIGSSMHSDETFFFRGKHLPMFRLSNIFSVPSTISCPTEGGVIILNNGGELVALLVDEIGGNCQTVIKSLGPLFDKQSGLAGCAIVNNGDIGLIIDVRSLVHVAKSDSKGRQSTRQTVAVLAERS